VSVCAIREKLFCHSYPLYIAKSFFNMTEEEEEKSFLIVKYFPLQIPSHHLLNLNSRWYI
jgi:hypothetical protein